VIAAWFMKFGSLTLQTFSDVDDLADTIVMLQDQGTDMQTYDSWGSFDHAVDTVTGVQLTDAEINAAKERAKAENAADVAAYVPPAYTHWIYLKDIRGQWHQHGYITAESRYGVEHYTAQLAGLLADGRAEIRPVTTKEKQR
jgi:hypothetical protein